MLLPCCVVGAFGYFEVTKRSTVRPGFSTVVGMLAFVRISGDSGAGCGGWQGVGIKRVDNTNNLEGG